MSSSKTRPAVGRRRISRRRLVGLDRSGPTPRETRAGAPLRPLTLPNLIGYLRLAGIPVFLWLSFESGDGRTFWAAATFLLIAVGDYVDGFVARATGQYSRLGALLDPLVDRLLVVSGAIVCWHFQLLPRWALTALLVREVVTLLFAAAGVRRGLELEINWVGRIAVFLVMGAIVLALVAESWVFDLMLVLGVALAVLATVIYVRWALARVRGPQGPAGPPLQPSTYG